MDLFVYCQFLDIFKRYLVPTTISSDTSFLIWSTPRVDSRGTLKVFQIIFLTAPSAHRPFGNLVFGKFMKFQCSFCKFRHKPLMNSSLVNVPSWLTSIVENMSFALTLGSPEGLFPIPSSILYKLCKNSDISTYYREEHSQGNMLRITRDTAPSSRCSSPSGRSCRSCPRHRSRMPT